jgi:mRNA interferase MazF
MTRCEFGDVVLVPFPFTDQATTKNRPAVVVSSTAYNTERPDLIVMAVTSQTRPENRLDIPVLDWQQAKLLKPSVVKPVIATIEQGLVIKHLGRLSEPDRRVLLEQLRGFLG